MNVQEKVVALLNQARESGIHLQVSDRKLLLKVDKQITPDAGLVESLKAYKEHIIEFLEIPGKRDSAPGLMTIRPDEGNASGLYPLSFGQERLWLMDKLRGSVNYHIPIVLRVKGQLDLIALEHAFRDVLDRHEVLRTNFATGEQVPMQIVRSADRWRMKVTTVEDGERCDQLLSEEVDRPFDLAEDYMMRCHLVQLGTKEAFLAIVFHHIAFDGASLPVFIGEITAFYESRSTGKAVSVPELPVQYRHYSAWQRAYLDDELMKKQLDYWRKKLEGVAPPDLPLDRPRPSIWSTSGSELTFPIDEDLARSVERLALQCASTSFITLLAAFQILLYRITGVQDVVVGIPVLNRSHAEITPLIGFFMNMLAIRSEVPGSVSFLDHMSGLKRTVPEAYSNQDVPFEKVVETVIGERDLSRLPLIPVVFSYEERSVMHNLSLNGVELEQMPVGKRTSKVDLFLALRRTPQGMDLSLEYCSDLFTAGSMRTVVSCYIQLLRSIVAAPDTLIRDLDLLSAEDKSRLIHGLNDNGIHCDRNGTILQLIAKQAEERPDDICVAQPGGELTYGDLKSLSDALAAYLVDNYRISRDDVIAVVAERGRWFLIAILAIWRSGAAYLPIEPDTPPARMTGILNDAAPRLIILESRYSAMVENAGLGSFLIDRQLPDLPVSQLPDLPDILPTQLAYVVYTSGTTGKPKGVMIGHGNLLNYCLWHQQYFEIDRTTRGLCYSSVSFDGSVLEMFALLISGAALVPVNDNEIRYDPERIAYFLRENAITHAYLPAAILHEMIRLRIGHLDTHLITGGEALKVNGSTDLRITNAYGPSETTVAATAQTVEKGRQGDIPIGKPISNTSIYVIDDSGALVPEGVFGQICIAGYGVGRGYLNNREETEQVFVKNPFDPERYPVMYKTGDIGRWTHDSVIEFRGRLDSQVKIRGFRVELGEIEQVLQDSSYFGSTIVAAKENRQGDKKLICYYVGPQKVDPRSVREYLSERLPAYMHPDHYVHLDKFPLSAAGKIDRSRLPEPDDGPAAIPAALTAPASALEITVASLWREILGRKDIGIHDNFFDLGGHSILATRVMAAISRRLSQKLPISDLFRYPTVSLLAERLARNADQLRTTLVPVLTAGAMTPIFCGPPGGGNVMLYYKLAKLLGPDHPVYAFQDPGADLHSETVHSIEEMAGIFVRDLLMSGFQGPYTLIGYSFGGHVVYEMAARLNELGLPVSKVFIMDTMAPDKTIKDHSAMYPGSYSDWLIYFKDIFNLMTNEEGKKVELREEELQDRTAEEQFAFFFDRVSQIEQNLTYEQLKAYTEIYRKNTGISYAPAHTGPQNIPIIFFRATGTRTAMSAEQVAIRDELAEGKYQMPDRGWHQFTDGPITVYEVACSHVEMMGEPNISFMARIIKNHL